MQVLAAVAVRCNCKRWEIYVPSSRAMRSARSRPSILKGSLDRPDFALICLPAPSDQPPAAATALPQPCRPTCWTHACWGPWRPSWPPWSSGKGGAGDQQGVAGQLQALARCPVFKPTSQPALPACPPALQGQRQPGLQDAVRNSAVGRWLPVLSGRPPVQCARKTPGQLWSLAGQAAGRRRLCGAGCPAAGR